MRIRGQPVEAPVEGTNDAILGGRREAMFPGVKEARQHSGGTLVARLSGMIEHPFQ